MVQCGPEDVVCCAVDREFACCPELRAAVGNHVDFVRFLYSVKTTRISHQHKELVFGLKWPRSRRGGDLETGVGERERESERVSDKGERAREGAFWHPMRFRSPGQPSRQE